MASFRFTNETPNEQLFTDVQNLNQFNSEQLTSFISIVLTHLISKTQAEAQLEEFAAANGVRVKVLQNTLRGVLYFFQQALKENMAPVHVGQDLTSLGLGAEKAQLLAEQWQTKFSSLAKTMMARTINVNQLTDMQWEFGVIASSSEVKEQGTVYLQLRLSVNKGSSTENTVMELSLPQFYKFLSEMQAAQRMISAMTEQ